MRFPDAVLMVFCKAPVPGQVKTRLIPHLSPEQAAEVHCELTRLTFATATRRPLCTVQLWCAPSTDDDFFAEISRRFHVARYLQLGSGLGERMHQAFVQNLSQYRYAILIGCDCPSLRADDLEQALQGLADGYKAVVAPTEDGGYGLIGLQQPCRELFDDMPWGTDRVWQLTRDRLHTLELDYQELPGQWDVDTLDDLQRYHLATRNGRLSG